MRQGRSKGLRIGVAVASVAMLVCTTVASAQETMPPGDGLPVVDAGDAPRVRDLVDVAPLPTLKIPPPPPAPTPVPPPTPAPPPPAPPETIVVA